MPYLAWLLQADRATLSDAQLGSTAVKQKPRLWPHLVVVGQLGLFSALFVAKECSSGQLVRGRASFEFIRHVLLHART